MALKNIPITIQTKTGIVAVPPYATESVRTYVDMLVDAAKRCKADPRNAVMNADDYPKLMKASLVEFAIGFLHGVAEALDVTPVQLFDAARPELAPATLPSRRFSVAKRARTQKVVA